MLVYICVFFIAGGIAGIVIGTVALAVIPGVILIGCIVYNTNKEKVCCFYDYQIPSHSKSWQTIKDNEH